MSRARPTVDDRQAARLGGGDHRVRMFVIDIDDRGAAWREQFLEQPQLGGEISLEARMIIEMIARDVGESRRRDLQSVEPILVEAMRGRFDRQMRDAVAGELIERAVQRDRVRRRQRAVNFAARRNDADRADAGGADGRARVQIWRVNAATEVLPLVPVTAAMVRGWRG